LRNALTVDVEDWFQVGAFETVIAREHWTSLECRVERNTDAVLQLLDDAGVKATFFTLGWVAERYPALMRRIADTGHEVASHGYGHDRVFTFTPHQFAHDISRTRKILEDATGQRVTGYRAPSFSIDQRTPWAHEILAAYGYTYSSSVAPITHDHYGWAEAPRFAFRPVSGSAFLEIPVTTVEWGPTRLAAGGGGFFGYYLMHFQDGPFAKSTIMMIARPFCIFILGKLIPASRVWLVHRLNRSCDIIPG
jgi:polysaccharide deacetylase family protein (PEP-CTERM system associated)